MEEFDKNKDEAKHLSPKHRQSAKDVSSGQITTEEILSNEDFVLKTQQQIAKDFAKFNLFFEDSFESTPTSRVQIERMIANKIGEVMQQNSSNLMQLLYAIDLPEKDFRAIIGAENFSEILAQKILFREAYKVYLRSIF